MSQPERSALEALIQVDLPALRTAGEISEEESALGLAGIALLHGTAGPRNLIDAMSTLQGQSTSNVTSIAQAAAIAALEGPQEPVETMRKEFDRRRETMVARLREIPGVTCLDPQGAFYAFPDVSTYVGRKTDKGQVLSDDVALCDYLLDAGKVAVVPGSGFGAPGFARLSYATSMDNITKGLDRMAETLSKLK